MCQATVYLGDEEVAQEVTGLTLIEDGVRLTSFFDEPRTIPGRVVDVDFLKHRVQLEPLQEEE
ncbi:MAG: CooT family nickel-binding protein [Anaerolineae bacterium]|jgi:predicted RNA-binding protein